MISDLNCEKIAGSFHERNYKNNSQEKFGIEKDLKVTGTNCMSNGKDRVIHLIVGLMKNTLYKN